MVLPLVQITKFNGVILLSNEFFKKINRDTISDQIIEQVKGMIKDGTLQHGDSLPSERRMAEMLGVSRLPLREALKALKLLGIIDYSAGSSYKVVGPGQMELLDRLKEIPNEEGLLKDLKEFRLVFEVKAVELACHRRTEKDLENIEKAIFKMEKVLEDKPSNPLEIVESSIKNHNAIMDASKNALFCSLYAYINDIIRKGRERTLHIPGRYREALEEHKKIFQAIKDRDVESAVEEMKKHIQLS